MSDHPLSRLLDSARRHLLGRGATPIPGADTGRRGFFRRAGVVTAGAVGTGLMIPDDAWAGVEERAAQFGIVPGTVVDAQGRPAPDGVGADTYLGEIMLFCGNFTVRGYTPCNGALLPISANTARFSIIGTIYGGDGRTTFAVPDLQGREAVSYGSGPGLQPVREGMKGGQEQTTLTVATMPQHNHWLPVKNAPGDQRTPAGNILAGDATSDTIYAAASRANAQLAPTAATGGGIPFSHRRPSLVLNFQIATVGVYPSRS